MKKIIALLFAVIMIFNSSEVFAYVLSGYEMITTGYFNVVEGGGNTHFSIMLENGGWLIDIRGEIPIYFEDGTFVIDTLEYGQTISEVLDGRKLTVTYRHMQSSSPYISLPPMFARAVSIKVLDEEFKPLYCDCGDVCIPINNEKLDFDFPPMIVNDRVFVPFRAIFEALGLTVEWDNDARSAIGISEDVTIEFPVDSYIAYINGEDVELDVPAMLYNDRTLVPLRFVVENSGAEVEWHEATRTVSITTN